jgi:hypothetical protein
MWSLFPSTMIVLFGHFCNPCTGFFCGFARRCPTLRIACICFFRSCARRCSPRRIAGTRFFGGCARRCPTRLIRCSCFLAILLPLSHLPCELGRPHRNLWTSRVFVLCKIVFNVTWYVTRRSRIFFVWTTYDLLEVQYICLSLTSGAVTFSKILFKVFFGNILTACPPLQIYVEQT